MGEVDPFDTMGVPVVVVAAVPVTMVSGAVRKRNFSTRACAGIQTMVNCLNVQFEFEFATVFPERADMSVTFPE